MFQARAPAPNDPLPVHLSPVDRGRSNTSYDQFAQAVAVYEASPDISPFSSKFDYALAHPDEQVLSSTNSGMGPVHGKQFATHVTWMEPRASLEKRAATPAESRRRRRQQGAAVYRLHFVKPGRSEEHGDSVLQRG